FVEVHAEAFRWLSSTGARACTAPRAREFRSSHDDGRAAAASRPAVVCCRDRGPLLLGDLDAPVLRPALLRAVAGYRVRLAPALGRDPRRLDAALDHIFADRVGASLRTPQAVGVGPARVVVAHAERPKRRATMHR